MLYETHLLQYPWVFWLCYIPNNSQRDSLISCYENHLLKLVECHTIEDFANSYAFLQRPSELKEGINLQFFRFGLKPLWEHFPDGGCLLLKLPRKNRFLDEFWEKLLVNCIRG